MKRAFILACAMTVALTWACKKKDAGKDPMAGGSMKVMAPGGLRMRETPDLKGKVVVLIPNGTVVDVVDVKEPEVEVSGKKGLWTKVKWDKHTGWVFGGFLGAAECSGISEGEGDALPSENDYTGKILGPALQDMEGMDGVSFKLDGGNITAECLLGGSGKVKIDGTYTVKKSGEYVVIAVKGKYEQVVVAEQEQRKSGDINGDFIRMKKKNGRLFGDVTFPQCSGFRDREIR